MCVCNHLLSPRSPCRLELRSDLSEAAGRRRRRRNRLDSRMQTSFTYVHKFLNSFLLTSASGLPFRYQTNSRTPAKQRAKKKRAPISFHILPEEDDFSTKTTLLWSRPISTLLSEVVYSTILRSHFGSVHRALVFCVPGGCEAALLLSVLLLCQTELLPERL